VSAAKNPRPRVRLGYGGGARLTGESARNTRRTIGRLAGYTRPYRIRLAVVALLVLVSTATGLAGPILLGRAIDNHVIPKDLPGLARLAAMMLVIALMGGVAAIAHGLLMVTIAQRLIADIRGQLFDHLQELSMVYHDRHKIGDLMSR
jgi:ATP-binding cassette subfamily B protein